MSSSGAASDETLRLSSAPSSGRTVHVPKQIGSEVQQPNTKLIMPYPQLHFEEIVPSPQIHKFILWRFLENFELGWNQSFKSFDGCVTYYSSRCIAMREVISFVALVLHRYDIKSKDPSQRFPRQDESKPTLGVIALVNDYDVMILVEPRSSKYFFSRYIYGWVSMPEIDDMMGSVGKHTSSSIAYSRQIVCWLPLVDW